MSNEIVYGLHRFRQIRHCNWEHEDVLYWPVG